MPKGRINLPTRGLHTLCGQFFLPEGRSGQKGKNVPGGGLQATAPVKSRKLIRGNVCQGFSKFWSWWTEPQ